MRVGSGRRFRGTRRVGSGHLHNGSGRVLKRVTRGQLCLRLLIQDREHGRNLRRCVNLSRRQHLRNALFGALRQLSGTHYRKLFSVVTLLQFLSLGSRHSSSIRLSLLSLLTDTLPGTSASEVTTLWRYTNLSITIIIIIKSLVNPCSQS